MEVGSLLDLLSVIDPVAFRLGGLEVRWYGLIIGIAIFLGVTLAEREANRKGYPEDFILDLVFWAIPIGFLGARLYYILFEWPFYMAHPSEILKIWHGGLAIYGGLIAGGLTTYWYCKKRQVSFLLLLDIVAPVVLLGQMMGRWGNFVNQEAHGGEVSRQFLENLHLPEFIINQMNIHGVYYQPTFLYESLWSAIGLVVILVLRRRVKLQVGQVAWTYVLWYSFGRFFIEGLRTDSLWIFGVIRVSQALSLVLFVAGLIGGILYYKRQIIPVYYKDATALNKTFK